MDYNKGWDRFALRLNLLQDEPAPLSKRHEPEQKRHHGRRRREGDEKHADHASFEKVAEERNIFGFTIGIRLNIGTTPRLTPTTRLCWATPRAALNAVGLEQVSATNDLFIWNFGINELLELQGQPIPHPRHQLPHSLYGQSQHPGLARSERSRAGFDRKFILPGADQIIDRDGQTLALTVEHRVGNLFLQLGYTQNML